MTASGLRVTLRDVVEAFRADSLKARPDATIEFTIGDVAGFSRLTGRSRSVARTSFFLGWYANREQLQAATDLLSPPLIGRLDPFVADDGTHVLRLLFETPLDADFHDDCRQVAGVVRSYTYLKEAEPQPLLATLAASGLPAPPTTTDLGTRLRWLGPWQWGTYAFEPMSMYLFDPEVACKAAALEPPQMLFCHAGHGVNSYGLNLFVSRGPLAAYVQHGWSAAYADPIREYESIAQTYARLHVIFNAIEPDDGPVRWLLAYSEFRNVASLIEVTPDGHLDWTESIGQCQDQSTLFQRVVTEVPGVSGWPIERASW